MELDRDGKRSNALNLRHSWQKAQVFAAREELAPAAQLRIERMRANGRRQRSRQAAAGLNLGVEARQSDTSGQANGSEGSATSSRGYASRRMRDKVAKQDAGAVHP